MARARGFDPNRFLHEIFEVGLAAKGLFAALELAIGLGLFALPAQKVAGFAGWLTRNELAEDPRDWLANHLLQAAQGFNVDAARFYAIYLASHGAVKLALVSGLWFRVAWAYPLAIVVFAGFIVYQLHRFALTGAWTMIALSVIDAVVIWLTWREFRLLRAAARP